MPYPQTDWKDHVVERPNTYTEQVNGDGSKTYTPAPGEVVQQGTPMSATNFNKQEEGIGEASMLADLIYTLVMLKLGHSDVTLDGLMAGLASGDIVAKKAAILETARTFALTGGATGTATSFDGSGNVAIPVTSLDATKLSGKTKIENGGTNATDAAGARANLDVPSNGDLIAATIYADLQRSVDGAIQRDLEERLITAEAQIAALGT